MSQTFDFATFPTLTTERLILRRLTHADADAIRTLFSDPQVLEFMTDAPTETLEQAVALIDWMNSHFEQHSAARWGITLKGDDRVIGTIGFHRWDAANFHADLGYDLLPSHWGHGYATEAARAVIGWCFDNLGLNRIQADYTDGNLRSERVMLKCGFQFEGLWREQYWEHGRFVDIRQYGLLRREWQALG